MSESKQPGYEKDSSSTTQGSSSSSGWTSDYALVGQVTMQGRVLVPLQSKTAQAQLQSPPLLHGSIVEKAVEISSFHPEDVRHRQPALWRGLVKSNEDDEKEDASSNTITTTIPRSLDLISSDLTDRTFSLMAPPLSASLSSRLEERLFRVVYQHILSEVLPVLMLTAACEEMQSQFLKTLSQQQQKSQQQQQQSSTNKSSSNRGPSWSDRPPEYYTKAPNSYLTAPVSVAAAPKHNTTSSTTGGVAAASLFPSFTPSQLASRIKQGCGLIWKHYCDHYYQPPSPTPQQPAARTSSAATASSAADAALDQQRRLSTRIARQPKQLQSPTTQPFNPEQQQQISSSTEPSPYWKVLPGGKVALYVYQKFVVMNQQHPNGKPDATTMDKEEEDSSYPPATAAASTLEQPAAPLAGEKPKESVTDAAAGAPDTSARTAATQPATGGADEVQEGDDDDDNDPEALSTTKNTPEKDDEDFVPGDDNEEDEEEEGSYASENVKELVAEAAREKNSKKKMKKHENEEQSNANEGEEEKEEQDADEGSEDEGIDLVMDNNPFLHPTAPAVLEWLGRMTAKLLTVSDIQEIMTNFLFKSKKKAKKPSGVKILDLLTDFDRQLWRRIDSSVILSPDSRVVFRLTTEHEDENIEKWETSYFGRTQLTIMLLNDSPSSSRKVVSSQEEDRVNELMSQYKERKTWDTWRYKSIHRGYTIWPSWLEAVRRHRGVSESANKGAETTENGATSQAAGTAALDSALAQALAQQEVATMLEGAARRTTRRGGDSSGVFYGNQSNMTQKQLMDALLRLISDKGFQTAASLVTSIPDESSDPLRRIRGALGKLIWRRNQVSQMCVHCDWTDGPLISHLLHGPILAIKGSVSSELSTSPNDESETAVALTQYIQTLHETELRLRRLVLQYLTRLPIVVLATAADERPGSMEAMDSSYFHRSSSMDWRTSGHALLGRTIFRPSELLNTTDRSVCRWYRVTSYCESVASTPESDEISPLDRPSIGSAKEPAAVERRMRFLAAPIRSPSDNAPCIGSESEILMLTEAQVHAGLKAAAIEQQKGASSTRARDRNPFSDGSNPQITLFPVDESTSDQQIHCVVAGHDTSLDDNGSIFHRILLLPQKGTSQGSAMWVRMDICQDSPLKCTLPGCPTPYLIQQFDYHSSSPAFRECQSIVQYLQRHPKAGPFLEPVDPIALKIPNYPDIVKNPMDISTLSKKLEMGRYSNFLPAQTTGLSPISRMLNGPFRKDVELIFDNAMLFNPPDDWIHLAAAATEKAVLKKIDQVSSAADQKSHGNSLASKSVYVDYDSDVDMYVYESDQDDEYVANSRRKRKHSTTAQTVLKEDTGTRVIERPLRLQKFLSESTGRRGPFADLPIYGDASSFTLPSDWTCRHRNAPLEGAICHDSQDQDVEELLSLQQQIDDSETTGFRRSTRSHGNEDGGSSEPSAAVSTIEFVPLGLLASTVENLPTSRREVEFERERLHEEFFAKAWKDNHKLLHSNMDENGTVVGSFAEGSFPPYLGRLVPSSGRDDYVWEIREPFAVVALRWVLRGLVQSEHLSESEPMIVDSLNSGAILPNNIYTISDSDPFEELDVKELTRRKRTDQEAESSEEEVELSEYEKQRAERVARNEERLKALGLA